MYSLLSRLGHMLVLVRFLCISIYYFAQGANPIRFGWHLPVFGARRGRLSLRITFDLAFPDRCSLE